MNRFQVLGNLLALITLTAALPATADTAQKIPAFSDFDSNNDGWISANEYATVRGARMEKMAAEGILLNETNQLPLFSEIDLDDNGQLDGDEFATAFPSAPLTGADQAASHPNTSASGSASSSSSTTTNTEDTKLRQSFGELDTNRDGKVTVLEFDKARAKAQARRSASGKLLHHHAVSFHDLDLNGDGILTRDEYEQATQQE